MSPASHSKKDAAVLRAVDAVAEEMVGFLQQLVRIPTINPPGEEYTAGANFIGAKLKEFGYDVQFVVAEDRPEHTPKHPRINVMGHMGGSQPRPSAPFQWPL